MAYELLVILWWTEYVPHQNRRAMSLRAKEWSLGIRLMNVWIDHA